MQSRIVWACLLLTAGLVAGIGASVMGEPAACLDDETCVYLDDDGPRVGPAQNGTNQTGNQTSDPEPEPEPEPEPDRGVHACEYHVYALDDATRFEFPVDADAAVIEVRVDIQGIGDADVILRDGANATVLGALDASPGMFFFDFSQDGIGEFEAGLWSLEISAEGAGQWFWQVSVEY